MPPTKLIALLEAFRRRIKTLSVATGLGYAVAAAVGLLFAAVLFDYVLNLAPVARLLLLLAAIVGLAVLAYERVIRPAVARVTLGDVAGRLETAFPQFDDRLRSTVTFLTHPGDPADGAPAMKQRVINEAVAMAATVDVNRAIVYTPLIRSAAIAAGATALLAVFAIALPDYSRIALHRLLAPFSAPAWPKSVEVSLADALPPRVAVGQPLPVRVRLDNGDRASRQVVIRYQYFSAGADGKPAAADGPVREEFMNRGDDGVYTATLDARLAAAATAGLVRISVESGDDRKEIGAVGIVPQLNVQRVTATVTPPKYTGLQPATFRLSDGPVGLVAGSDVALEAAFNKPLAADAKPRLEPLRDQTAPAVAWARADDVTVLGTLSPTQSVRFNLRATDADGFENRSSAEYELNVRPDLQPSVHVEEPRRNEERTAAATVPLRATAEDDFAVRTLTLRVERVVGEKRSWDLELVDGGAATGGGGWEKADSAADRVRMRLQYAWELAKLDGANLKPGDVLEYHLVVTDNYDLLGKRHDPVASGKLRVTIISQDELTTRVNDEIRAAAAAIRDVRAGQARAKVETGQLADDTRAKPEFDPADKAAAERLAGQQATGAAQANQIAGKFDELRRRLDENKSTADEVKALTKEVGDHLSKTAEGPMRDGTNALNSARDRKPDQKDQREKDLNTARENQEKAEADLGKILDRIGSTGSLSDAIESFRGLLQQQQALSQQLGELGQRNLGKKPEQMSPEDRAKLEQLTKDQRNLADKTQKTLDETKKAADQNSKSDPASSKALEQAADTGKQQNVPGKQRQASQAAGQNQQSQAQQAQKQAEIGLEMILANLREAERRKLEELARKLEALQQQVAMLVKRQATHNLDNLVLQGGDAVARVETAAMDALLGYSERSKDAPGGLRPATLPQLTGGQEQTERNARDLAKAAEEAPEGAAVGAHLTRAASRMERAIVSLRAAKLPDAYAPPQVEALAALTEAKRVVDEEKAKADEKREEQKKEAIRQRYVKLRDQQAKLNDETVALDNAPRGDGGARRRQEVVRLGQLPGVQGGLTTEAEEIGKDVEAVGGLVYVWANKDILAGMNASKDGLGRQETGEPVQEEQARVVAQLDAMIKSLMVKPLPKTFEQAGGGGPSGEQGNSGPRLPTEAELRLLKALQQDVNARTRSAAKVKTDEARIAKAGDRQGELRRLLDELLQKSTKGEVKLGPEPDNRDQLPEEASADDVEDQELDKSLLADDPTKEDVAKASDLIGDRMARSRQRLAINHDPGKVTQAIQERILIDLDAMIEQSRKQEARPDPNAKPQQQQGEQMARPDTGVQQQPQQGNPQPQQQQANGQSTPADQSSPERAGNTSTALRDLTERNREWGSDMPERARQAVLDSRDEKVIPKYKTLVDDYYKALANKRPE